jgi:hypothetical protein
MYSNVSDPLLDLLVGCCVRVRGTETGTGFFVGPGLVLTCAHVVGCRRQPGDTGIIIESAGGDVDARLRAIHPDPDDDLALLEVDPSGERNVWLDDSNVLLDDRLVVYGFPGGTGDTRTVCYEGASQRPGGLPGRFHHLLKAGQIVHGFSGGPVLDLRTAHVIGVVTETRGYKTELGGTAIPTSHVRRLLPGLAATAPQVTEEVKRYWLDASRARSKIISQGLSATAGRPRALPFASAIERFIADYRGSHGEVPFGGRRLQLDELSAWLDDPALPYALVAAPAGRGKSAFLVRWLEELASPGRQADSTHVVFAPVSIRYQLNSEEDVFRVLVSRLEEAHGGGTPSLGRGSTERDEFSAYLRMEPPAGSRVLVVIDALDEAEDWDFGPDLFPIEPTSRVKVVVSVRVRADRSAAQWLQSLGWTKDGTRCIELPSLGHTDVADLLRQLGPPLADRAAGSDFVARLHRLADGGDPLLLSLFIEDLRRDPDSLDKISDDGRPSGLEGYFDQWWKQQERLWGGTLAKTDVDTRNIFNLMATAFGPLRRRDVLSLARRLRSDCTGDNLDEALRSLARFVVCDQEKDNRENDSYVLAHPLFAEYRYEMLRRDDDQSRYDALYLEWGRATLAALDRMPSQKVSPYIVRHYGSHLERAVRQATESEAMTGYRSPLERTERFAEEFLALVSPAWRTGWDALGDDYGGYYRDVQRAYRVAAAADQAAITAERPGPFISDEWRCAYELALRKSLNVALHPRILGPLLRDGRWGARRCLTFIQQLDKPYVRAEALAAVLPHLQEELFSQAEQLMERADVDYQESIAPAVATYCLRLWHLGRTDQALQYARNWKPGLARCLSLVKLAPLIDDRVRRSRVVVEALADLNSLDWRDLSLLLEGIREAFTCFGLPPLALPRDDEWITPGLDAEARAEGLRATLVFIARATRESFSIEQLYRYESGQHLHLVLPWLTKVEAAEHLSRLFAAIEAGEIGLLAMSVMDDVASFVPQTLLDTAVRAAETAAKARVDSERQAASVLLALAPVMSMARRADILPRLLRVAANLNGYSSLSDRRKFAVRMVNIGLGDKLIDRIEEQFASGDIWTCDLVEAMVPHLSLQEVSRLHSYASRKLARTIQDDALPIIDARYAELDPQHVLEALVRAERRSSDEADFLFTAMTICVDGAKDNFETANVVRWVVGAPHPDLRITGLAAVSSYLDPRISSSGALEVIRKLQSEAMGMKWAERCVVLEAVALLTAHFSRDAALDPAVQSAYLGLPQHISYRPEGGYIASFCQRLIALNEGDAAIKFGSRLGPIPPEVVRIIPELPTGLAEKQLSLVEESDDCWLRCAVLAALRPYVGDEPWRSAWDDGIRQIERWRLSEIDSVHIAFALRQLPKEIAEQAFSASLGPKFRNPDRRWEFVQVKILTELVGYYPSAWLDCLNIEELGGGSSTDRSLVCGAIAVRLAELGRAKEAFECAGRIPYGSLAPEFVGQALAVLPQEAVADWVEWSLDRLTTYDHYPRIWGALAARWASMPVDETLRLCHLWLDRYASRPLRYALIESLGFLPAIERLGGKVAIDRIRLAITPPSLGV